MEILSKVNKAHFEAEVPYSVCIQGVTRNTKGCLLTITTPGVHAAKLIHFRESVIAAARKLDAVSVDIKMNGLCERARIHVVNVDRYLGQKTRGGIEKLRTEIQAKSDEVEVPLAINWIGGPKNVQKNQWEGKKASSVMFAINGRKKAKRFLTAG